MKLLKVDHPRSHHTVFLYASLTSIALYTSLTIIVEKTGLAVQPEKTGTSSLTGSVPSKDRSRNRPGVNLADH
uniref:OSJNBa0036E02.5 protein n=1 Tax=Oryza sativa subsp. japonica TaxID=39947 RepID=Q7F7E6_ORYSJ|nr:OSJNBa0036E02.5 [Oryza sativa Japonica Group]